MTEGTTLSTESSSQKLATGLAGAQMLQGRLRKAVSIYYAVDTTWALSKTMAKRIRREFTYEVAVYATDDLFTEVEAWLVHLLPEGRRRRLSARTTRVNQPGDAVEVATATARRAERDLRYFHNADGATTIRLDGQRVTVTITRPDDNFDDERKREWLRAKTKIEFTTYSKTGRQAVQRHLEELHESRQARTNAPRFSLASRWGGWHRRDDVPNRDIDTVILRSGQKERLVDAVQSFFDNEDWYRRLGIPYHFGLLLEGPPGTGKTTICRWLASQFQTDVYYLPLADLDGDSELLRMVSELPAGSMLIVEDADIFDTTHERGSEPTEATVAPTADPGVLRRRRRKKQAEPVVIESTSDDDGAKPRVTLSGLLNAMDGIATPHGIVMLLTTNKPGVLDRALIRPGRIDLQEHIGPLDEDMADRVCRLCTGEDWTVDLHGKPVTPAELIGAYRIHQDLAVAADELGITITPRLVGA